VIFDNCQGLDVAGPLEVFHGASAALRRAGAEDKGYAPFVVASTSGPIRSESGLVIQAETTFAEVLRAREPLDTLVVAGGPGVAQVARDATFLDGVRRLAEGAGRVASVCTGAFVLAAAGLLDGRRATTHWAYCETLAQLFPQVTVDPDSVYVRDGPVWSSAGVTAGMDLALALVERDFGPEMATTVARWLVVFVQRAGAQAQISEQLKLDAAERRSVRDLAAWIVEHPGHDLAVPTLARRIGMSVRNFARVFRAETGLTPGRYVERVRLEAAKRLLENSGKNIEEIAAACGFGTAEALRRVFGRSLGLSPRDYRGRLGR
jgi:transcriptional regulator GlxA family with amidase domain